ncbi:hypothetical protein TNCV_3391291 [Trichonephila clavipes]|nr:hypothetical protein TNCV_3391291 [Trichonephila clavipes]
MSKVMTEYTQRFKTSSAKKKCGTEREAPWKRPTAKRHHHKQKITPEQQFSSPLSQMFIANVVYSGFTLTKPGQLLSGRNCQTRREICNDMDNHGVVFCWTNHNLKKEGSLSCWTVAIVSNPLEAGKPTPSPFDISANECHKPDPAHQTTVPRPSQFENNIQTITVDNLWPIHQILDGAPAVNQDPHTVLIRVKIEGRIRSEHLLFQKRVF